MSGTHCNHITPHHRGSGPHDIFYRHIGACILVDTPTVSVRTGGTLSGVIFIPFFSSFFFFSHSNKGCFHLSRFVRLQRPTAAAQLYSVVDQARTKHCNTLHLSATTLLDRTAINLRTAIKDFSVFFPYLKNDM